MASNDGTRLAFLAKSGRVKIVENRTNRTDGAATEDAIVNFAQSENKCTLSKLHLFCIVLESIWCML